MQPSRVSLMGDIGASFFNPKKRFSHVAVDIIQRMYGFVQNYQGFIILTRGGTKTRIDPSHPQE